VIHCQFGTLGVIGKLAKRSGRHGGVLTVSFRGYDISREVRKRGPGLYERLFGDVDMCFPNSEFFGKSLLALGCPPEKVRVQHSGIDVAAFPFRGVSRLDPARLKLLSVGRLVEKKGFSTALAAVAALASRYPGLEYTIVGAGPLRGRLLHEARILGIEERVSLPGPLTQEAIRDRLAQSSVMISASVTAPNGDQDGPVNVLKEAMAVGLPVVATAHGGIPELVQDGVTGLLVPEGDAKALADGVEKLIRDPALLQLLATNARREVARHWDNAALTRQLRSIYLDLANEKAGAAAPPDEAEAQNDDILTPVFTEKKEFP
jgi:colanic acid/amylovoran biosynthesis glycosyltransferase